MANSETRIEMMQNEARRLEEMYDFQLYEAEKQRKQRVWTLTSTVLGTISSLAAGIAVIVLGGINTPSNSMSSNDIIDKITELEQRIDNTDFNLIATIERQTETLKNYELQAFGPDGTIAIKTIGFDIKSLESKIDDLKEVISTDPEKVIKNALLQDRISDVEASIKSLKSSQNERFDLVYRIIGASMGGLFIALLIQLLGQFFNSGPHKKKTEE